MGSLSFHHPPLRPHACLEEMEALGQLGSGNPSTRIRLWPGQLAASQAAWIRASWAKHPAPPVRGSPPKWPLLPRSLSFLKGTSGRPPGCVARKGPCGGLLTWRQGTPASGFFSGRSCFTFVIIISKGQAPSPSAVPLHNGSPSPSSRASDTVWLPWKPGEGKGNLMPVTEGRLLIHLQREFPGNAHTVCTRVPLGP